MRRGNAALPEAGKFPDIPREYSDQGTAEGKALAQALRHMVPVGDDWDYFLHEKAPRPATELLRCLRWLEKGSVDVLARAEVGRAKRAATKPSWPPSA